jgi:glycosyltransferase involved in cell wall biosynthesis
MGTSVLHKVPAGTRGTRVLFLPNWPVAGAADAAGRQSPDYYPSDGQYWFFRHFAMPVAVDVLDTAAWPGFRLEESFAHFYLSQGLAAARIASQYDLVFAFGAQSAVGLLALLRLRQKPHPPVIVDDAGCLNAGRPDRRVSFSATRWALGGASRIIWHSTASLELCRELCPELAAKGEYLPFGTNLRDLAGVDVSDGDYAVCAGNSPRGWTQLATAWRAFPGRRLLLLGSDLRQADLPSHVLSMPKVPFRTYVRLLAGARLVVLPLPDGWASWGQMTLLQAMALGKPVVVTDVRPVRDYISQGCVTVRSDDYDAMLREAGRLWLDADLRRTLGRVARQAATERFDEALMANRLEAILVESLG